MQKKRAAEVNDSDKGEIKIVFYKRDIAAIIGYSNRINKMVERGDKVPARVLKKLLSFFEKPLIDERTAHKLLLEDKEKQVRTKLFPDCDFNIKLRKGSLKLDTLHDMIRLSHINQRELVTITLDEFLINFFTSLENKEYYNEITADKRKFIEGAYTKLNQYLKLVPVKKRPTLYRRAVIIGHLGVSFDLIFGEETKKNSPSYVRRYNQFLYNETAYIIKKINKIESENNRST